jgi:hypothetical protein
MRKSQHSKQYFPADMEPGAAMSKLLSCLFFLFLDLTHHGCVRLSVAHESLDVRNFVLLELMRKRESLPLI